MRHLIPFAVIVAGLHASPVTAFSSSSSQQSIVTRCSSRIAQGRQRSQVVNSHRGERFLSRIHPCSSSRHQQYHHHQQQQGLWEQPGGDNEKTEDLFSAENAASLSSSSSQAAATTTYTNNNEASLSALPSYKKLVMFTATTILIWISEPLLSLVDTTVVSLTQTNAVVQVAALGPATTLIDSLQYLTYFLAMATTSQLAKFLALKDYRQLQQTTSQILGVAAVLGVGITAIVFGFGLPILTSMIGSSSQSPELVGLAAQYCWIRASVAPLAVMGMVAESSCLANVDTMTPAIAVFTAAIVNVIGDLSLSFLGMQGAAIATAVATVTSTSIMLRKVKKRKDMWRQKELEQASTNNNNINGDGEYINGGTGFTSVVEGSPTISIHGDRSRRNREKDDNMAANDKRGVNGASKDIPFLSLPDKSSMIELVKLSGPMFFVMLGKIACYGAMSIRATDFGVVNLAAHSIMMRIFFFFTCFGDSLSQAAQSFLPTALYPKPITRNIRKMLKRFLIFSTCVGLFISVASNWILSDLVGYLTNDKAVIKTISKHSKFVSLSLLLHPFIMLTEGTMIATRDFRNIVTSYSVTIAMHFTLLLLACTSFQDIWRVLFLFQSIRLSLFSTRVIQKVVREKAA